MTELPDGWFALEPHHAWLWTDAVGGDHAAGVHPGVAILVALRGAGASIAAIMARLDTAPHRVLFGELGVAFDRPLAIGVRYRVATTIAAIVRKAGRRFASFDEVTLAYRIDDDHGPVATVRQAWIVDRT